MLTGECHTLLDICGPDIYSRNAFRLLAVGVDATGRKIKRNEAVVWIQREVDEIANIQRALLPRSMPTVRGMRVRAFSSTFDRAGGDYYDVLPVGAPPGADLKQHPEILIKYANEIPDRSIAFFWLVEDLTDADQFRTVFSLPLGQNIKNDVKAKVDAFIESHPTSKDALEAQLQTLNSLN